MLPAAIHAVPINAKHRHFNGSGQNRALFVSTHDLPLLMNVFHNERFIFDTGFDFSDISQTLADAAATVGVRIWNLEP